DRTGESFGTMTPLWSLDGGDTWDEGTPINITSAAPSEHSTPLMVGSPVPSLSRADFIESAELRTLDATLIAGVDFTTEWPPGTGEHTDTAGRHWTLHDGATVPNTGDPT